MIFGIGIDLVEIARIGLAIHTYGDSFIDRIFTEREKDYCYKYKNFYTKFANRFAAKEAVCKSFGLGIGIHRWKDFEILNHSNGKPLVILHNKAKEFFESINGKNIFLSISDTDKFSIAYCIVEV